ncbi:hypothetical protein GGR26_003067 [Lewinella marina]|uniref:M43 family zinc metalloprotease n=1 Tax=Neolewinella marina TaxID=438751 RepID=UPI000C0464F0|nr:M43 family zinc metalloprotease [Neolewinella marina]NJB87287.1 hypothetical protein [Neolewinella marina]
MLYAVLPADRHFLARLLLPMLLTVCLSALAVGQAGPLVLDFEAHTGLLNSAPLGSSQVVTFGTPSVSLVNLPPLNNQPLGPVNVFSRDDAPSGTQAATNCSEGIGCEFPSQSVLFEFSEPTGGVSFAIQGFDSEGRFLIYGYGADGQVELLATPPASPAYQTVRLPPALGYIIDLETASALRTFFIDDLTVFPAADPGGFDCGTGEELLLRLEQDPVFRDQYERINRLTDEYLRNLRADDILGFGGEVITIPVVVHVVYNTAAENISDAQVQSQIDALNDLFRATNAGVGSVPSAFSSQVADLQIQFALAQRDPDCEPTNGITRTATTVTAFTKDPTASTATVRNPVKFSSTGGTEGWPSDEYLNIWVCDIAGTTLGYAAWPADFATRPAEDGIVMDYTAFGTTGTVSPTYNLGRVCAHEIGHWLNLRHIWGDDSALADICSGTDEVDDTPNQGSFNASCPAFPSTSCGNGPDGDMFMNHMDYTTDACRTMFTVGQHVRAAATLFGVRADLIGSDGLQPPPESPAEPDLWSADTHDDTGAEPNPSTEAMYHSADIWVRNSDDGFLNQEHQNPVYRPGGEPNYVYVRVRNRGCGGSASGTNHLYWAKAGSGVSWPAPWDGNVITPALMGAPIGSQPVTVDGGEFTILQYEWVVPNPDDYASIPGDKSHFCLLARTEEPGGMTFPETGNLYANVQNNNNIVWKNVSVGDEDPATGGFVAQVLVGNYGEEFSLASLQFSLPQREVRSLFDYGIVTLEMGELFGVWEDNGMEGQDVIVSGPTTVELLSPRATLMNLPLEPGQLFPVEVRFLPHPNPPNAVFTLNMTQADAQTLEPFGGNQLRFRTAADGLRLPGDPDPGGDGEAPVVMVDCPQEVAQFCEFPITVRVDMNGVAAPDDFLGNFTATLTYDPTQMEYLGESSILSDFTGFINDGNPGVIVFNGAHTAGHGGDVPIFTARFRALAPAGTAIHPDLETRVLAAAHTFADLLPNARTENCDFVVADNQLLGDVNGDGLINSTDAALVLAHSVGNALPPVAANRILGGIGDVDADGLTDSRDALFILTYDVGLPVDLPLGTATACLEETAGMGNPDAPIEVPVDATPEVDADGYRVPLTVDMRLSGERLGSYLMEVSWDAQRYRFDGLEAGSTAGFERPTANLERTADGHLRLAHANPLGADGQVHLASLRLRPLDPDDAAPPQPTVVLHDLTAAGTFRRLSGKPGEPTTATRSTDTGKLSLAAYPNPFDRGTRIVLQLKEPGPLLLEVFNGQGQRVAEVARGPYPAGTHTFLWNPAAGSGLPTGVYLLRATLGTHTLTERLLRVR